jgi:Tfp pilus assembly protein PilN
MRRIDLLPQEYVERRQERRNVAIAILAGALVLVILIVYYFVLLGKVSSANGELSTAQSQNAQLQSEINKLQSFAALQNEVTQKETSLKTVMAGDVDWPALMTELAMVVPGEVWLTDLTASAGQTEGATPVGSETNSIPISAKASFGRIQFTGNSLSMPGIAKWLIRLASVKEFSAIWLNGAQGTAPAPGAPPLFNFTSTLQLDDKAASGRFESGKP